MTQYEIEKAIDEMQKQVKKLVSKVTRLEKEKPIKTESKINNETTKFINEYIYGIRGESK